MHGPARDVDDTTALEIGRGGAGGPNDPPSSAWSYVAAPADEDAGFEEELILLADDDVPLGWGGFAECIGACRQALWVLTAGIRRRTLSTSRSILIGLVITSATSSVSLGRCQ